MAKASSSSGRRTGAYVASLPSIFSLGIFVTAVMTTIEFAVAKDTYESPQGWQTLSDYDPASNFVMIPKYFQSNHAQMVLGAKFAQQFVAKSQSAAKVVDWYPIRNEAKENQIKMIEDATRLNGKAVMISNNAGEGIQNVTKAAREAGLTVVSYDSPIPGGYDVGENLFVTGVDFDQTGIEMATMALSILGDDGGDFCIMSTTPDATNQNSWIASMKEALANDKRFKRLNLVDTFWPEKDDTDGYTKMALEIVKFRQNGTYPDLSLIMAPTTSGSAAAARALMDNDYCDIMKVSGLSVPAEMLEATERGCSPEFALFNNLDLGFLAYMATHAITTGAIEGKAGDEVDGGRLGKFEVTETDDGNRLTLLLGDFIRYNEGNVERAAFVDCIQGYCGTSEAFFEERFLTKYKKKTLAIIPKVTGAISFICSTYLVYHILKSKKRRQKTYERVICGLSLGDMITSFFGFFLSTWPKPAETFLSWGALGTTRTCEAQGFLFQLGILATPLYSVMLASFYLLTVTFGWKEDKLKKIEWLFHLIPWASGLATAIAGLMLGLFNPSTRGSICWIEEYPPYCSSSLTCERGQNAVTYRWAFLYAFVVFTFFWLSFCMAWVWKTVLDQERKLDKYQQDGQRGDRKHSRNIASQALFYVVAFTIPWVWGVIIYIIDDEQTVFKYRSHDDAITWLHIVNTVIFPMQGLFNVLVYVRPRYLRLRKKEKKKKKNFIRAIFTNADSTTKATQSTVPSFRAIFTNADSTTNATQSTVPSPAKGNIAGGNLQRMEEE